MALKEKVGKGLKKLICSTLIAGSLLFGGISNKIQAQEMPKRDLYINSTSPLKDSDVNADLTYSANQLLGKLNDYLGTKKKMDSDFLKRSVLFAKDIPFIWLNMAYSHELGHLALAKKYGDGELIFNYNKGFNCAIKPIGTFSDEEDLKIYIAGVNQNRLNEKFIDNKNKNKIAYDNSLSALFNSLCPVNYARRDAKRESYSFKSGDIVYMREYYEKKGINLSGREVLNQVTLGALANLQTYENIGACWNYLANGQRETQKHTIEFGNTELSLPGLYHYWTTEGGFYELNATLNPKSNKNIELRLGSDADSIGGGKLSTKTIGAKLNYPISDYFTISPEINLDFAKQRKNGYSAGLELIGKTGENSKIIIDAKNSRNNVLENMIKDNENGFNASIKYSLGF